METEKSIQETLKTLFTTQKYAVLATQEENHPYLSLMAFIATDNLKKLIFATERDTRKYINMINHPQTAALIDNRSNQFSDTEQALAVTALGVARECANSHYKHLFLKKHPQMKSFIKSPTCTLVEMRVSSYFLATGLFSFTEFQP